MKQEVLEEGEGVTSAQKRLLKPLRESNSKLLIICCGLHFNTLQT